MTVEQRMEYIEKVKKEKEIIDSKAIFAFYALTMTVIYWYVFGFGNSNPLQFLNFPTYFLTALPVEAIHQLAITPVHIHK